MVRVFVTVPDFTTLDLELLFPPFLSSSSLLFLLLDLDVTPGLPAEVLAFLFVPFTAATGFPTFLFAAAAGVAPCFFLAVPLLLVFVSSTATEFGADCGLLLGAGLVVEVAFLVDILFFEPLEDFAEDAAEEMEDTDAPRLLRLLLLQLRSDLGAAAVVVVGAL